MDPLSAFGELVIAITTFAVAFYALILMVKMGEQLQSLPGIGGFLASGARAIGKALNNAATFIFGTVEAVVGGSFHAMAGYINKTWHLIAETPAVLAHVAKVVGDGLYRVTGIKALVHRLNQLVHTILHRFVAIDKELHGIEHGIKVLEKELGKGIGEDVLPRLRHLERKLTHIETKTIPAIEDLAGQAETDAQTALGKINAIPWDINWRSWADAISAGLTAVGLSWLFCRLNPFNRNKNACIQLGDLGDLLGLIVALEAALNFEQLVHEAQDVAELTSTAIMDVFGLSNG